MILVCGRFYLPLAHDEANMMRRAISKTQRNTANPTRPETRRRARADAHGKACWVAERVGKLRRGVFSDDGWWCGGGSGICVRWCVLLRVGGVADNRHDADCRVSKATPELVLARHLCASVVGIIYSDIQYRTMRCQFGDTMAWCAESVDTYRAR